MSRNASQNNISEKNPLTDLIDNLIKAKREELYFSTERRKDSNSLRDKNANATLDMSRFGLQTPDSFRTFLLTPAGETVKHVLGARIAEEEALKKDLQFRLREESQRVAQIQAALFLWLIEKEAHAADKLRDFIMEQAAQSHQVVEKKPDNKTIAAPKDAMRKILSTYSNAIKEYQAEHKTLQAREINLRTKLSKLEKQAVEIDHKHQLYEKSIGQIEANSEEHTKMDISALDAKIATIQTELETQVDKVTSMLDAGDEDGARKLLSEQNALHLQLAALHDIRAAKQELKAYYNEQGEPVSSMKDASFIVDKKEKIVMKNGQHYLLKQDQEFDKLEHADKEAAKERFQRKQPELMVVQKSVKKSMELEREAHKNEIDTTTKAISENREEQLKMESQILLMQSLQAKARLNDTAPSPTLAPKPVPANKGAVNALLSPPPTAVTQFLNNNKSLFSLPGLTPKFITTLVEEQTRNDPKAQKSIMNFLNKALNLGSIPSLSPLPETTMNSLLQHMARFGANAYKPALTALRQPLQEKPGPELTAPDTRFNPTPFSKNPFK